MWVSGLTSGFTSGLLASWFTWPAVMMIGGGGGGCYPYVYLLLIVKQNYF
jgi:hypothetical protein